MNRRNFLYRTFGVAALIPVARNILGDTNPKKKSTELVGPKYTPKTTLYTREGTPDYVITTEIKGKIYVLPMQGDIRTEVFQTYGKYVEDMVNEIANSLNKTQNEVFRESLQTTDVNPLGIPIDMWIVDSDDHTIFVLMDKDANPLFEMLITMKFPSGGGKFGGLPFRPVTASAAIVKTRFSNVSVYDNPNQKAIFLAHHASGDWIYPL